MVSKVFRSRPYLRATPYLNRINLYVNPQAIFNPRCHGKKPSQGNCGVKSGRQIQNHNMALHAKIFTASKLCPQHKMKMKETNYVKSCQWKIIRLFYSSNQLKVTLNAMICQRNLKMQLGG